MKQKRTWKRDIILLIGVLGSGAMLAGFLLLSGNRGAVVQIRISGTVTAEYPLDDSKTVIITGKNGGTNQMVIQDGTVCFSEATCPDSLCVHTGKISRSGQSIVCLPNEVVAEVVAHGQKSIGSEENLENQVDSVAK